MTPKLVIFDLDGTLLDTIGDVATCFNEALRMHGFPEHPEESYPALVGGDLETIVSKLLPSGSSRHDIEAVKATYRSFYAASEKPRTAPYPGIEDLLGLLSSSGVRIAANTNKGQALAEQCLKRYFPRLSASVVGYREGIPSKPDPTGACKLMEQAGVTADESLYIGDGVSDALTAKNAGMGFVWVSWGQGKRRDVEQAYGRAPISAATAQEIAILLDLQ